MLIKGIVDEDFVNYKVPSMFISTNTCTFKCDIEYGTHICQNEELSKRPAIDIPLLTIIRRYLKNEITHAIVFGGLEPMDQFVDIYDFVFILRNDFHCDDPIVIYTGYTEDELGEKLNILRGFCNITIKFGRYKPDDRRHYDPVLGVYLASDNQYAVQIS